MTSDRRRQLVSQARAAGLLGSPPIPATASTGTHHTGKEPTPMSKIYTTPLVRKVAQNHQVDLAKLKGTGVGGRITLDDVRAAAGIKRPTPRAAAPASTSRVTSARPKLVITYSSTYYATDLVARSVDVDVFGDNPLLDELQQVDPGILAKARRANAGPVPELFTTGPLPAFTSSGIDPSALALVPWMLRPYMARVERAATAHELVETYGKGEEHVWQDVMRNYRSDPGVLGYQGRMQMWWRDATVARALTLNDLRPNGGQ